MNHPRSGLAATSPSRGQHQRTGGAGSAVFAWPGAGDAPWGRWVSVAVGALALALWPLITGSFGIDLVTKTMIYAIVALSLELLVGTTGLVCFGQAAFFGLAAYAAVKLSPEGAPASLWWLLPASMAIAAAYA